LVRDVHGFSWDWRDVLRIEDVSCHVVKELYILLFRSVERIERWNSEEQDILVRSLAPVV